MLEHLNSDAERRSAWMTLLWASHYIMCHAPQHAAVIRDGLVAATIHLDKTQLPLQTLQLFAAKIVFAVTRSDCDEIEGDATPSVIAARFPLSPHEEGFESLVREMVAFQCSDELVAAFERDIVPHILLRAEHRFEGVH